MMRVCGPTCPHSSVWAHASAVQAPKRLINKRKLAILTSNGMPLGECRIKEMQDKAPSKYPVRTNSEKMGYKPRDRKPGRPSGSHAKKTIVQAAE